MRVRRPPPRHSRSCPRGGRSSTTSTSVAATSITSSSDQPAFVLDTKNLSGRVSVSGGVLSVRWREDSDDGYEQRRLASRMQWLAQTVETRLRRDDVNGVAVQPVVVLWASFEQGSILSRRVAWVSGGKLADVLRGRPPILSIEDVTRVADSLRKPWPSRARSADPLV